jgi:uncharacterized membrane protein
MRVTGWGHLFFAAGLIGIGALSLIYGDFALQWQPVPPWVPWRTPLAYASGAVLVGCGIGVLLRVAGAIASRVLIVYLGLWLVLLKVPRVVMGPLVEGNWLGWGEIATVAAGGWILFATLRGRTALPSRGAEREVRLARGLCGVALLPVGLSHLVYLEQTVSFVPAWLPARTAWAILTGLAHIAAGLAILLGIRPRLAATLEVAMIGAFTLLVWLPKVVATPTDRLDWTAFFASWIIGAGVWVVADSYRGYSATRRLAGSEITGTGQ